VRARSWHGWCAASTLLIILALGISIATRRHLPIWPNNPQWKPDGYADEAAGGKSRLLDFQNDGKVLSTRFVLSDLTGRYAGLVLNAADGNYKNYARCNELVIEYRTIGEAPLRLELMLDVPGRTHSNEPSSVRYIYYPLLPSSDWTTIRIPLTSFQTPEWWFRKNWISPEQLPPADFHRFLGLAICESEFTPPGKPVGAELRSATLEGPWWPSLVLACLLPVPWGIRLGLKRFRRQPRAVPEAGAAKPSAPAANPDFERLEKLVAEQFAAPDLSLAKIQRETGISESRISTILDEQTGLYFKPYLNQVRIEAACRLLLETELSIAEIADQVGYANTTHFNRVFKGLKQVAPGEFRRLGRNDQAKG